MLHATKRNGSYKNRKPGRGPTRFRGITRDAQALGVNRVTLYRVLNGQWKLPGLMRRYLKLKGGQP